MKSITITLGVVCIAISAAAQPPRGSRRQPPPAEPTVTTPSTGFYANLPGRVDTSDANKEPAKSQRPTHFYDSKPDDQVAIANEHIRWDDALFSHKVWSEIDIREKMNQTFRYNGVENNGSQQFINILLRAIQKEGVQAFADDRFSIPVSNAEITEMTQGKLDTFIKMRLDDINKPDSVIVTRESFDPNSVSRFRIMEEWIFDRESSRLHTRIIGIAALKKHVTELGGGKQREAFSVLFWVYFPDLRPTLAKTEVYNPKNMGGNRMSWDELFQSHMFSSFVTKSTIDNAANKTLREQFKDPRMALLEGEAIKEKIFNYEQDQWSY